MSELEELREYLRRYDEFTVPDYYYYAWKILFANRRAPNRKQIIDQAISDMYDEKHESARHLFSKSRIKLAGDQEIRPYNF